MATRSTIMMPMKPSLPARTRAVMPNSTITTRKQFLLCTPLITRRKR